MHLLRDVHKDHAVGIFRRRIAEDQDRRADARAADLNGLFQIGDGEIGRAEIGQRLADRDGRPNIITLAWVGTVCTNPPMVSISVRPERYSYPILKETGEFVINLTTKELAFATDYCGVKSGRDVDKFKEMGLTPIPASEVKAPMIKESPVNIECKVRQILPLGSHDMFLADVVAVHADEKYMDEKHKFHLEQAEPIIYSHGSYFGCGELLGTFGYSVKKR